MMGTQPNSRQPALFSYHINVEHRVAADHLLRRVSAVLDLSFVIPAVSHLYGRCGNVSLDPRVILKMMLLLFLYNIGSERELLEQIGVRLDFLWFLGFDLETDIPNHSVLSKARARWGEEVFQTLFVRMVEQCVAAGLVNGSLLHADSTLVKASASKDSVVVSSPELVSALRQAYQRQQSKLEVLAAETNPSPAQPQTEPCGSQATVMDDPLERVQAPAPLPALPVQSMVRWEKSGTHSEPAAQEAQVSKAPAKKLPVNSTHISTTDAQAELARNKSGVTELNYKEHRMVDDAHGVITALATTGSNVPDGSQLPKLYEQHESNTGLVLAQVRLAGDHHYGTASNYIYCAQQGLRAHLAEASANLEERGKLPLSQFVYEPALDRLRCPQGHYLVCHQERAEEQLKVYLIEDPALCAHCPLRRQCTASKRGRSIRRHVQADLVAAGRTEANSAAARYSRKRRRHVMEGSFADAFNNHGGKKARWRGLARQRIQSWLIATVQNLRILLRNRFSGAGAAATVLAEAAGEGLVLRLVAQMARWRVLLVGVERLFAKVERLRPAEL